MFDVEQAVSECDALMEFAKAKSNAMAAAKILDLKCRLHGLLVEKLEVGPSIDLANILAEARGRVMANVVNRRLLPEKEGE